jgi:hypothetical protein
MWEATNREGYCTVHSPDKQTVLFCFNKTFARRLARILNSTSMHKFQDSEEEMDMRGVPRNAQ